MEVDVSGLHGRFIYLTLLQPEDVPALRALAHDARLWEFTKTLLIDDTFDVQFDTYIAAALNPANTGMQISFVMRDAVTHAVMGMTRYYKIEPQFQRLSIGYTWYTPAYWGTVHNKECKLLLLQYAFEEMNVRRVEFEVAHVNLRSQKAVLKIGAVQEGILRNHSLQPDGSNRDTVVFSIINDEWPATKLHVQNLIRGQNA